MSSHMSMEMFTIHTRHTSGLTRHIFYRFISFYKPQIYITHTKLWIHYTIEYKYHKYECPSVNCYFLKCLLLVIIFNLIFYAYDALIHYRNKK